MGGMTDVRVLVDGLRIVESPRWHDGRLWFCHWGAGVAMAVDAEGRAEVVLDDPAVDPHTIGWLPDGRLLVVPKNQDAGRRLLRREPDGTWVAHADLSGLPAGLNELVVDGRGNVYVNGAGFGLLEFMRDLDPDDPRPLTQRPGYAPGFIALITADGAVHQQRFDIAFPNGMAVTADNGTLIVSESFAGCLTAFDIAADGSLGNRRVFAGGIGPDGICLDADGAVWTSDGGTAAVRVAEGGQILDRVELDRPPFAVMLGGDDGRTLFMLAAQWNPQDPFGGTTGRVLATTAPAPHVGWP
ncbi:SMP-30/gluconolactonase/LRE family protein [Dactylosporangium matsuzakiense]|uniref:Gluconolactonase n=2 Tax=Dactylosporangium matsuzakiense TaxID=53360 RepID=A0A9W6NLP1_9ACTN|nr:gluconolactonase [Dactylosporangium matsuzakiense]